nr:ankyrin repeat-containing protein BDA1-like [Ziziphus jujuba var. spinosa]
MEGSVSALNSLIHDDPLILSKISLTKFSETPLHIAALLGHLDFCKALLSYNFQAPKLALELDSLKRSPLHLASAAGHAEIVQVLLQENESKSLCLLRDQEERIPLHYAAMRGRVDTIKLLINAQPEYVFEKLDEGETVLHLCVQYNHLEALKLLVESVGYENREFHNMKDLNGGNTILHLAVMLKQIETITYLVSIPGVKAGVDTLNNSGLKAFNMLQHFPKDFRSLKIQTILMDHHIGLREQSNNQGNISLPPPVLVSTVGHHDGVFPKKSTKLAKASHWLLKWIIGYLIQYKGDWLEDARGSIMVVATVIATMTFQTAINPPGGVWQQNINATIEGFDCRSRENYDDIGNICYAGTSVLAYSTEYNYAIYSAVAFKAITFMQGVFWVDSWSVNEYWIQLVYKVTYSWLALVGIVVLFHSFCLGLALKKLGLELKLCLVHWIAFEEVGTQAHQILSIDHHGRHTTTTTTTTTTPAHV